jgi:hypothetical protein
MALKPVTLRLGEIRKYTQKSPLLPDRVSPNDGSVNNLLVFHFKDVKSVRESELLEQQTNRNIIIS